MKQRSPFTAPMIFVAVLCTIISLFVNFYHGKADYSPLDTNIESQIKADSANRASYNEGEKFIKSAPKSDSALLYKFL